jgi:hypothetical protein
VLTGHKRHKYHKKIITDPKAGDETQPTPKDNVHPPRPRAQPRNRGALGSNEAETTSRAGRIEHGPRGSAKLDVT